MCPPQQTTTPMSLCGHSLPGASGSLLTKFLANRMRLEIKGPLPVTAHFSTGTPAQVNHNSHEPLGWEGLILGPATALENLWRFPRARKAQAAFLPQQWGPNSLDG